MFDSSGFVIQDNHINQVLHQGPCLQCLYPIHPQSEHYSSATFTSISTNALLWHRRLGYPNTPLLLSLVKQYQLPVQQTVQMTQQTYMVEDQNQFSLC